MIYPKPKLSTFRSAHALSLLAAILTVGCLDREPTLTTGEDRDGKDMARDGGPQSTSYAAAVAAVPATALNFPSNGDTWSDVRFRFMAGNLLPMYPATYVWRINLRPQAGYYGPFFWGPNGDFTGNGYYGACPYPDGEPKSDSKTHHWAISISGHNYIDDLNGNATQVEYGTWKTQAFRVYDDGTRKVQEFYWDLPDTNKVIRTYIDKSYGAKPPPNPALSFGDSPWNLRSARLSGLLRGIQLYTAKLKTTELLSEVNTPLSTATGKAGIWYLNVNPTPSDISDKSGKGHNPAWVSSVKAGLWVDAGAPPAPTVALSAGPASITRGDSTVLTWSSTNAGTCTAGGAWSGAKAVGGSESASPLATSAFTLTCSGPGGSATQTVSVTVTAPPPAPPMLVFSAAPDTVNNGDSAILAWSSSNDTVCTAGGAWSGTLSFNGSQSSGPLAATSFFTVTCAGPGGLISKTDSVIVRPPLPAPDTTKPPVPDSTTPPASDSTKPPVSDTAKPPVQDTVPAPAPAAPTLSLSANPASVDSGNASTLTWSSANAAGCEASGAWTGTRAVAGSQSTGALSANSTFTLTCTGPGGSVSQSASVAVILPPPPTPTVSLSASPADIESGSSATLTWSSAHATRCTAGGDWTGSKALSGSQSTGALSAKATFTLTCTGPGGIASQSAGVSVSAPPSGGGGGNTPVTGLIFPSNDGTYDDVRFKFKGANLQPMYPATYIVRTNFRRQKGYYTIFFWGPDGEFTGKDYYGICPYPDGDRDQDVSTTHKWELSISGHDYVEDDNGHSTQLGYDTWRTQALRVWDDGVHKYQEFYWELPDTTKVIRVTLDHEYSYPPISNGALTFGTSEWGKQSERLSGILRGVQTYSSKLSTADIVNEANSPMSTAAGKAGVWYVNVNPTPDDISDKSGRNHNPVWQTSARAGLWQGP